MKGFVQGRTFRVCYLRFVAALFRFLVRFDFLISLTGDGECLSRFNIVLIYLKIAVDSGVWRVLTCGSKGGWRVRA